MNDQIQPFRIEIPDKDLEDLQARLRQTRWGSPNLGEGWTRGVPLAYLQHLAAYWADEFDWRAQEKTLNALPHFKTEIDGQPLHFVHVKSAGPKAPALLLLHDWPASHVVFNEVIDVLSDHFNLVIPDMPGVAFSGPLKTAGWTTTRIAATFTELMDRLGYERYGVQGQGGGAWYAIEMGRQRPEQVIGVHLNGLVTFPLGAPDDFTDLTPEEQERLGRLQEFRDDKMGFYALQSTRPYTLGHALHDSPAGQLAWIVERFKEWTDAAEDLPGDAVDIDTLLTNISLYWFTATAGSSANLYYDLTHDPEAGTQKPRSPVPTAIALATSTDITIRRYAERDCTIVRWTEFRHGGNFLPLEQPDKFIDDVLAFFEQL